jgi:nickel/cobalt transporter (NicO) family protein
MPPLADLLRQGGSHAWLFIPSAILLGALHGLEPGHSKTMMAAFIIAVRGTVAQAVMLGLAATVSHTFVVWAVALLGLYYASQFNAETTEPYLQLVSAVLIVGIAAWIIWRTWRKQQPTASAAHHHHHGEEVRHTHCHDVAFTEHDHHDVAFTEHGHHDVAFTEHDHRHGGGLDLTAGTARDAHELAHANDIRRRFVTGDVTTGQIVMFGLTGGLIPCPAAITVLLLCLQLKQFSLGVALVLCFSIGLALTMVTAGVIAALSVQHVTRRWSGFGAIAARAPYFSSVVIVAVGLYVGWQGVAALHSGGPL